MDEIKELAIAENPERKEIYETEMVCLKTDVIVVELREQPSRCLLRKLVYLRVQSSG